ncbi:hypothetical protein BASA60_008863 [Batrachochytrium salamandrivorans]|nr:hypothetical protein BASA60_008863 [Batrachochytrium salamandrivorans]
MFGPALTLVLALASSAVIAAPTVDNVYKRAVASLNPSSTEFPFHFPESVYENTPLQWCCLIVPLRKDDVKTATDFISKKLNLGANDFKVVDSYTDAAGVTHVYGAHILNGARIANHQASAHVKNGQVTSFSSSFGTAQHLAKRDLAVSEPKATLDFAKASATASAQLDGKVVYAYKLQLRNNPVTKWVEVWCDATTGKVIQAVNFANKASYKAIPFPRRDAMKDFQWYLILSLGVLLRMDGLMARPLRGNNVITLAPNGKATPSTRDGVFDTQFNSKESQALMPILRPLQ